MFDKNGNLKNWWDKESFSGFVSREGCMKREYEQYSVQGRHVSYCGLPLRKTYIQQILFPERAL